MVGTGACSAHRKRLTFATFHGADALKAAAFVGAMTVHSFTEGAGVGVSFGGGATLGVPHRDRNRDPQHPGGIRRLPGHGSARSGRRPVRPLWSIFTSLPQPLVGGAGIPVRRGVPLAAPAGSRLRGRSDVVDGRDTAASRCLARAFDPERRGHHRNGGCRDAFVTSVAARSLSRRGRNRFCSFFTSRPKHAAPER